jgi:hypothetical protein
MVTTGAAIGISFRFGLWVAGTVRSKPAAAPVMNAAHVDLPGICPTGMAWRGSGVPPLSCAAAKKPARIGFGNETRN